MNSFNLNFKFLIIFFLYPRVPFLAAAMKTSNWLGEWRSHEQRLARFWSLWRQFIDQQRRWRELSESLTKACNQVSTDIITNMYDALAARSGATNASSTRFADPNSALLRRNRALAQHVHEQFAQASEAQAQRCVAVLRQMVGSFFFSEQQTHLPTHTANDRR